MRSSDDLLMSSDLLRSPLCPDVVALESDEVVLFALSLSRSEDVLSLFIFELSDLLSVAVLEDEELGVEVELVSWLWARALGAASARARTDNAMNLIENLRGGCVCKRRLAMPEAIHNARPLARRCADRSS